jgi:hypothetical protein
VILLGVLDGAGPTLAVAGVARGDRLGSEAAGALAGWTVPHAASGRSSREAPEPGHRVAPGALSHLGGQVASAQLVDLPPL